MFLLFGVPVQVTYFKVLKNLSSDIMPYMVNPLMLCDFLTDSFSIGTMVDLLLY